MYKTYVTKIDNILEQVGKRSSPTGFLTVPAAKTSCDNPSKSRIAGTFLEASIEKNLNFLKPHKMSGAIKRLVPLFDRVLIKKAEAITKTKGGIVIPEKAQAKVLQGTIVAVGPGGRSQDGSLIPLSVKVGDNVLLPEYGGTKVEIEENTEYHLYRESDILAKVDQ